MTGPDANYDVTAFVSIGTNIKETKNALTVRKTPVLSPAAGAGPIVPVGGSMRTLCVGLISPLT